MGNTCTGCQPCASCNNREAEEFNLDDLDQFQDPLDKRDMASTGLNSAGTQKGGGSTFQAWPADLQGAEAAKYVWHCPGYDSDDEIDELKRFANPTEVKQGVRFSKNGMLSYIDRLLSQERPDGEDEAIAQQWTLKLDTPTFKYWCKNTGDNLMTLRIESTYVKKFSIAKLAECLFDADLKVQWDKKVEEQEYADTIPNCSNIGRVYYKNKSQLTIEARDYNEKVFTCWANNKLYRFSSSCYDSKGARGGLEPSTDRPVKPKTVRADCLYSMMTMERVPEHDDRVKLTYLASLNLHSAIPMSVIDPFMATATRSFFSEL